MLAPPQPYARICGRSSVAAGGNNWRRSVGCCQRVTLPARGLISTSAAVTCSMQRARFALIETASPETFSTRSVANPPMPSESLDNTRR